MKQLEDFKSAVMSLEGLTATILSSEKGFSSMPKLLKEELADRLQSIRVYLLFSNGMKKGEGEFLSSPTHSKPQIRGEPCPVCSGPTQKQGSCSTCMGCGWSKCS